jgi:hypothetical protein
MEEKFSPCILGAEVASPCILGAEVASPCILGAEVASPKQRTIFLLNLIKN